MAKKKIHIDELFRRELGDMKMPVDSNDWSAMQAQIAAEQDKRKRRVFWWWFAGIALLLLIGAATTYYLLDANNSQSETVIAENTTSTPSVEKPSETETQPQKENEIENSTSSQPANNEPSSPESVEAKTNDSPSSTFKPSNAKEETEEPKDKVDEELRRKLESFKNRRNRNNNGKEDSGENTRTKGTDTPYPKKEQQTLPKITPKPNSTENNDSNTTKETTATKVVLPDSTKAADDSLKAVDKNMLRRSKATKPNPSFSPFSLGLHIGGASNNYVADNNSQLGRIVNSSNENSFVASAEFSANYKIKDFEINSGIGIKNISQSINYNITRQIFDSIPVFNPQGQIIGYFYTNFRDTAYTQIGISNLNYITLPIGITYNKEINPKSGLRFSANTTIHYLEFATGDYINPFNLFGMSVDQNRDLFRRWNLGLGASVGYYYTIKPQWILEASINYSTLVNGIFDDRIGTAIRPSSIGINVGIRYNFKLRK